LLGRLGDRCSALVVQFGCSNERRSAEPGDL
jgi:hypothetical protein